MSPTLQEEMEQFREARRDLGYLLSRDLRLLWLIRKLGLEPKGWLREREIMDAHGNFGPKS